MLALFREVVVFWQLLSSITDEQVDTRPTPVTVVSSVYVWKSGGYLSAIFVSDGRLAIASSCRSPSSAFQITNCSLERQPKSGAAHDA
ncbi:hypothetical protein [Chloroflexus sp.]|uniref:hypothetical protein n=1 Tax=Chloroflexus sp. TaxID=1904827 RepID=UPI002ACD7792|nr:hypothetical protein [Chloroflexus sp.]